MKKSVIIVFIFLVGKPSFEQIPVPSMNGPRKVNVKPTRVRIDSTKKALEKTNQFRFKTGYLSKVVFVGRNFGVNQFGIAPGVTYHHRSGVNLEYEGNYWSEMDNRYALTNAGLYYEKSFSDNFYLSSGYWRSFFHSSDRDERKMLNNYFTLEGGWFNTLGSLGASYYFVSGTEQAHRLDLNLSKSIDFYAILGADRLSLEPAFTFMFSTANYLLFLDDLPDAEVSNPMAFKIANYELVLPIIYRKLRKFEITGAWHYASPVNVIQGENLKSFSYLTLEITRILTHKNVQLK